jgi:hypothetical protein
MTLSPLSLIGLALVLMLLFSAWKPGARRTFRSIKAIQRLQHSIELSVEDGSRLQVGLGHGGLLGPQSAAALAGLTLLRQVAEIAADSDQPPVAASGDGALMLLAQDTLRSTYRRLGIREQFTVQLAQTTGVTPFSYAAGTLPAILDRDVLASALVGHFGAEAGLIAGAAQRSEGFSLGGSDGLTGQAVLFAAADEPLIGEEVYATGAYTDAGNAHQASLRTQDVLRWLVIILIIIAAVTPVFAGAQ